MADDLVERLAKLDTCAVSDALDRLGLKGSVIGVRPMTVEAKIAGRAVTVRLKAKGREESTRHLGTAAVEAASPGDIIVIDHHGREDVAGWGGILSTAAKAKGVGGVVIDGAARDIDESRGLGLPVYAKAAVQITARGRIVEESTNEPIEFAGVSVEPGDLVIADGSGVVFVAAGRAEEVLQAAEEIAARETEMAKAVTAGQSVMEVMGLSYESMLSRK
jgi:regulator of RNase E activity RraA